MKIIASIILMFSLSVVLLSCDDDSKNKGIKVKDVVDYEMDYYMKPYWEGNYIVNEPVMILKDQEGKISPIRLLYDIQSIVSVRNHRLDVLYKEGEDYRIEDSKFVVVPGGAIENDIALEYDNYYFDTYIENVNYPLSNGKGVLKTEADYGRGGMTDYQVVVTYTHDQDEKRFSIPFEQNQKDKLTNSLNKIQNNEETHIVLVGDSVSAGWSASGYQYSNIPPYSPNYFGLVEEYLCERFNNQKIIFDNYAISGETTKMLLREATVNNVKVSKPDLVIIAYGANDGTVGGNISPQQLHNNINEFIQNIRKDFPNCEFMILTSAIVNVEISGMFKNQANYTKEIKEIAEKDDKIAVVDIYRAINEVLMRKRYIDVTANNINHPNDFMHRLYAQMIIKTLIDDYE